MDRAIEVFQRFTRAHALLLTCTCASIFLLNLSQTPPAWPALNWPTFNSNENEVDAALQSAAESALGERDGSIIVMDAQTGRVRAAVNPDLAYSQAMMPGSSIKPFTTLAALRAGLIDEDSRTVCPGRFTGLSFSLACVHADHLPPFNPSQAIAYSCNYYFATLGQRLGRDKLPETLRQFGFGQPTGVGSGEVTGTVTSCGSSDGRIRSASADDASQQADCAAREAIGESERIQVTPIQLLAAYTALLNDGHLFQPQSAGANDFHPMERRGVNISSEERRIILEGMSGAIRYGTARNARLDSLPLTIVGKTGTAQPPKGFRTNGWFVGFAGPASATSDLAPRDVQLAVIVFLPRAHGAEAATISRPIFEAYANEIRHRDAEAQRSSNEKATRSGEDFSSSPRLPVSSTIKVHLVTENITRELSLEDYVLGVMRAEGTMEDQREALKALAIAIRTFTVKHIGRHAKDGYDFCSTTHCQRFVDESRSATNNAALVEAVRATAGQVLTDDRGELIDSYFGASCGGETANIATLWGTKPAEYLSGVRDEYCDVGPHAHWTDTVTRADLLRALNSDSRTEVGSRLDQIVISKRDDTGRAEFITIEGEQRKIVRGWNFKIIVGRVLGWNVLKSSRFEISRSGSNFIFRGSGFGHGLGLCQEGAHVMASRGASYQRILEKYFPGTRLSPRSGNVTLAQPFKAGIGTPGNQIVAAATIELHGSFQSSLTRRTNWAADLFPVLKGWANFTHRFAAHPSASARFLTVSSDHFRVTYPNDVDRREANNVLTIMENARADYLRRAGSASISVSGFPFLEIRINDSTGNFVGRTGQPWWAAAATKGDQIELQPLAILKRRGVLNQTLKHELAHVLIDAVSHNRAPRWLEEGFAIYLAGEGAMYSSRVSLSQEKLEERLEHPRSQAETRAAYAAAYAKVGDIVRTKGEGAVWTLLQK